MMGCQRFPENTSFRAAETFSSTRDDIIQMEKSTQFRSSTINLPVQSDDLGPIEPEGRLELCIIMSGIETIEACRNQQSAVGKNFQCQRSCC